MKLREVTIKNFRGFEDVTVPIDDTTILIGQNNCGKTAFLDALKLSLRRYNLEKSEIFDEYDYHMSNTCKSPQESKGITIELWFKEDTQGEWPEPITQVLDPVIQYPSELRSIGIRLQSTYQKETKSFDQKLNFIQYTGDPLPNKSAYLFSTLLMYIQFFYLQPLRDSSKEFSSKSQYWGKVLKNMNISDEKREELNQKLGDINKELIQSDPRLSQIVDSIGNVQKIIERGSDNQTTLHALPQKPWDLMSKAEIVIKRGDTDFEIPLIRHGQGTQSLSVLYLFNAYIEKLLKPLFKFETEAILAIEEPEAHLHPQACRALAKNLEEIKCQKIISSHSPYFIQEIPFKNIRMFRKKGEAIKVLYLKEKVSQNIPAIPKILQFCASNSPKYHHDENSLLTVRGPMNEKETKQLIKYCFGHAFGHADGAQIAKRITQLSEDSKTCIPANEIPSLQTYIKRIRGEILFAKGWLLCEGQSEYILLPFFAGLMNKSFDEYGISIIDFQNNGSAGIFPVVARIFEIPWIMICDSDPAGLSYIENLKDRGFSDAEITNQTFRYPEKDTDIELFLIKNGFLPEYLELIKRNGTSITHSPNDAEFEKEIADIIKKYKTEYMIALVDLLKNRNVDESRIPQFFKSSIERIIEDAGKYGY